MPEAGLLARVRPADLAFEFGDQRGRETVGIDWEGLVEPDAGHLPVACRRVFAGRTRSGFAVATGWVRGRSEMVERLYVRQAEAHQIREMQQSRAGDVA